MKTAKHKSEDTMKVLKTSSCKTVTGKSTLTYQIGALDDTLHLRIGKNSGNGQFSNEWIPLRDIRKSLDEAPEGQPLTSFLLRPLFKGKSVNTPTFLMAALTNEKLLRVLKDKKRGHEFLDPEGFDARMQKLAASKGTTQVATKKTVRKKTVTKKTPGKKAAVKKKAMSRRKQKTV